MSDHSPFVWLPDARIRAELGAVPPASKVSASGVPGTCTTVQGIGCCSAMDFEPAQSARNPTVTATAVFVVIAGSPLDSGFQMHTERYFARVAPAATQ